MIPSFFYICITLCILRTPLFRTAAFKKEELDECEHTLHHPPPGPNGSVAPNLLLLDVYFPKQVLNEIVRPPNTFLPPAGASTPATEATTVASSFSATTTHPPRHSNATFHQYRATQRIPAISVYCLFLDDDAADHEEVQHLAERGFRLMLKEIFPCNLYRLNLPQLLPPLFKTPYQSSSLRQRLHDMALDFLFPDIDEDALLLIDAGARVTALTAFPGGYERHCQFLSLRHTLQLLHQHTGKLPDVSTVLDGWQWMTDADAPPISLPDVWGTNTADAVVAAVVRAHALAVRQAVVVWARSVDPTPRHPWTCVVTGADCDRLLAVWNHDAVLADDDLVALPPPPTEPEEEAVPFLQWRVRRRGSDTPRAFKRPWNETHDEIEDRAAPVDRAIEEEDTMAVPPDKEEDPLPMDAAPPRGPAADDGMRVGVYRQRNLLFHGVRALWRDAVQQRDATANAVERWRHNVLGCRIAKSFGASCFVGAVTYVDRDAQCPDVIDRDLLTIHYDDGDVEDFNLSEFYGTMLLCELNAGICRTDA
jgi:hypothetical protein